MPSFEDILARLAELPMFEAERPATDREIEQIQVELMVTLPEQYILFLRRFGYAGWFGHEILGIHPIDRVSGQFSETITDCITKSKREREKPYGTSSIPAEHIVISTDGGGGNFVLFTIGSPCEGQVHWYNFEDSPEAIMIWETFQDFLEYQIENAEQP